MTTSSLVFIDARVSGYENLINDLPSDAEVVVLDSHTNGLEQIAAYLSGRTDIAAIHVLSHGSQGALYLGKTRVDSDYLNHHSAQLASIGNSLSATGDILLYGCNVAQSDVGLQFMQSLASLTGADVAASVDTTGSAALGGNSVLEAQSGSVQTLALDTSSLDEVLAGNTAPTFMVSDGMLTTDLGSLTSDNGKSVTVQIDGKILVAGYSNNDFALVRYNSDGSLDTSFSIDGKVTTDFGYSDAGYSVTVQADGKILVAGQTHNNFEFALVRYNSDGSLDTSFSGDGKVTTDVYVLENLGRSVTVQADGKILVAGTSIDYDAGNVYGKKILRWGISNNIADYYYVDYISTNTGYRTDNFSLVRYNLDGSLDTNFSNDGKVITSIGILDDSGQSVAVQSDGKILVAGTSNNGTNTDFALVRYKSDGTLDTSFSTDGMLTTAIGTYYDYGSSIAIQADGKILVSGCSHNNGRYDFALARYKTDGILDTSFSQDGIVTTPISTGSFSRYDTNITVQSDGKILITGATTLIRYNFDGTLDTSFSKDGVLQTPINAASVTVQADGKILVAGSGFNIDGNLDFALARYNNDGTLDTRFSSLENSLQGEAHYIEGTSSLSVPVTLAPQAQIWDSELVLAGSYKGATLNLSRHGGANAQDVFLALPGGTLSDLTEGSYFFVDGISIGRVINATNGNLMLAFNYNATQELVNHTLQQIAYSNTSDAPPTSVEIDWTFSDGNTTGTQGTGGNLTTTSTTMVSITPTDDAPIAANNKLNAQTLTSGIEFSYSLPNNFFIDPDQRNLTYTMISSNESGTLPPWLEMNPMTGSLSGIPDPLDVGTFSIRITAKDDTGFTAFATLDISIQNPLPDWDVAITGTATQGQVLTATHTLVGLGGVETVNYQWLVDGMAVIGATGSALTLGQALVGKSISVTVSYTDSFGTTESKTSSATHAVVNVNDLPIGSVTINGTATQNETLTATYTLTDADGLGSIHYQWRANGTAITGATDSTYTLGQADVGKTISVTASYTDGQGTTEAITSATTAAVTSTVNTITGNSNNNVLLSTVSDDAIDGGAGTDTVSYANATAAVTVTLASNTAQNTGGAGIDTLLNIENLTGSKYNDKLTGNAAANVLNGGAGADTMTGGNGNDTYYVNHASDLVNEALAGGTDTVYSTLLAYTLRANVEKGVVQGTVGGNLTGNALANTLTGNAAANQLNGSAGNDTLNGNAGNDTLIGGAGKDALTGGTGNDVFKFNTVAESGLTATTRDVIADFVRGQDKIDISTIDANTALTGNQAFTGLIGANVAFTKAGQLKLVAGVLYGNTDADAAAEFSIALTGITTLANTDFVL